ncbi:DUF374 domain-containing protein [Candidatus Babeliales bacterium]|nr:DUF374 domain-containing protein [Candidatus Babeliales bacterium]
MLFKKIGTKIKQNHILRGIAQQILYLFLRLLFATYRLRVTDETNKDIANGVVYSWHQQIIPGMFFFFKRKILGHCVVSPSSDGQLAGFVTQKLGFTVLYGSPYKSPITLVRKALTVLKTEKRLCLVGDGSRGPAKKLQPGVTYLAKKSELPLIFIDCKSQWKITLKNTWDQLQIPLPFSKIFITVHKSKTT